MNVRVTLPSGKTRMVPRGVEVQEIVKDGEFKTESAPIVAAMVNNNLASLTYRIEINCSLAAVRLDSREGANIYRRSLCFLLAIASNELFPDRRLVIGHSLGNGYFYYYDGLEEVRGEDLKLLEERMREIVLQDRPIQRQVISYQEAVDYFRERGQLDTAALLEHRNDPKISVYRCGSNINLAYAPLLPATGLMRVFQIMPYPPGFLLRYPSQSHPEKVAPFVDNPVLFSIYREYKNWGKILNVGSVGQLNELIRRSEAKQFIQVAEALHEKKIAEVADRINEQRDRVKLILIAGPSSSGKTTFCKRLSIQLKVLGRNPVSISLDDYFQSRELTPKDEQGNYDFESLKAIDVDLLNEHLLALLQEKEVFLPSFDFFSGSRKSRTKALKLPRRAVLILEGIHGLNDELTPRVSPEVKYKIYVSALTQLNLDDQNRISTTDNRLIRRMVRDFQFRGHSALDTLSMWPSVRRGEDRNIFPFQNTADSAFNSALDYELAVLKVYAEPQLRTVKPNDALFYEARRLMSFLDNFTPIPPTWVPPQSILREFIGESAFKY